MLERLFFILIKRDEKALQIELRQPYVQWRTILLILIVSSAVSYLLNQVLGAPPSEAFAFLQNPLLSVAWGLGIFFLVISLSHLIAKIFGSPGHTKKYTYVSAVIWGLVTVLNPLAMAIPIIGTPVLLLVGLYAMVLTYFAGSHVYNMHMKSTLVIVFAPILFFVGIFSCTTIFMLASSVSA